MGVHAAAGVASVTNDETLTSSQMERGLAKQIPVLKEAIELYDTLSGRARDMARVEEQKQKYIIAAQRDVTVRSTQYGYERQATSASIRAGVFGGASAVEMPFIDQRTATGEKAYQIATKLLPVRQKIASAEREAAIAAKEQEKANERYTAAVSHRRSVESRQYGLEFQLTQNLSGPRRQQLLVEIEAHQARQQGAEQALQRAAIDRAEAQKRRAEQDAALRQARLGELQARQEIKAGEVESAQGAATRLGGMGEVERQFALYSLQHLQKFGSKNATPEIRSAAYSAAPQTVAKIFETEGAKTPQYQQLAKLAPLDVAGNLEGLRQQNTALINEISKANLEVQKDLTDAVAKSLEPLGKIIAESVLSGFRKAIAYVDIQVQQMKNSMH